MRRYLIITLFVFISLCLIIAAGELILRSKYHEQLKVRHYPLIYRSDSLLGYTYIPDTEAFVCMPSIEKKFRLNNNGYYGPSFDRKKTKFRIAIVGASESGGIWLNDGSPFSMVLQNMLDEKKIDAEVLNFSVDGRVRDVNNIRLIKSQILDFSPDIILLNTNMPFIYSSCMRENYKGYVINYNGFDPQSKEWCKAKIDYITEHALLSTMYNASYIVRALCRYFLYNSQSPLCFNLDIFIEKRVQAPDIYFEPYSLGESIRLLKEVEDSLKSQGGKLVLYDYNFNDRHKQIFDKFQLNSLFLNVPQTRDMEHEHDDHYNKKAHTIIAQQLYDSLISRKFIHGL